MNTAALTCRELGRVDYAPIFEQMRHFTAQRTDDTEDEFWFLEHHPVFTQGQAGQAAHLLATGDIPVIQSDRGGQVTYHGPGQLVVYFLLDLHRLGYGIRSLVMRLEQAIIDTLADDGIEARARRDAPGVYVGEDKIASLGLRVRNGRTYHGIAINVDMDLEPFSRINPCGYSGLKMCQTRPLGGAQTVAELQQALLPHLCQQLGYTLEKSNHLPAADIQSEQTPV